MKYYVLRNFKYQVAEDTHIGLFCAFPDIDFEWFTVKNGVIYIKKGYAWDGASGPTIDTKTTIVASLIHDCLYQAMRLGLIVGDWRKDADRELRFQMVHAGASRFRAFVWYCALRLFGGGSAKKGRLQGKDVKEAV